MAMFVRKRARRVRLSNRLGSRRTRILLAISFSLIAVASYLISSDPSVQQSSYYVAVGDLAPDLQLNEENVALVNLDLKDQANRYLQADSKVSNWVLAKPIRAGELIPLSALSPNEQSDCVAMKIVLGVGLVKEIHRGDLIDLWSAGSAAVVETAPVQIVESGLLMESNSTTDSLGQSKQSIEICVSIAEIRSVVQSLAKQELIVGVISK